VPVARIPFIRQDHSRGTDRWSSSPINKQAEQPHGMEMPMLLLLQLGKSAGAALGA